MTILFNFRNNRLRATLCLAMVVQLLAPQINAGGIFGKPSRPKFQKMQESHIYNLKRAEVKQHNQAALDKACNYNFKSSRVIHILRMW